MLQGNGAEGLLDSFAQQLGSFGTDALIVIESCGTAAFEIVIPTRTLRSLEAVFGIDRH